jgi:hypothetical protein
VLSSSSQFQESRWPMWLCGSCKPQIYFLICSQSKGVKGSVTANRLLFPRPWISKNPVIVLITIFLQAFMTDFKSTIHDTRDVLFTWSTDLKGTDPANRLLFSRPYVSKNPVIVLIKMFLQTLLIDLQLSIHDVRDVLFTINRPERTSSF